MWKATHEPDRLFRAPPTRRDTVFVMKASGFLGCACALLCALAACATVKADAVVMSGAFAACAKADLGKVVTAAGVTGALETVVATIIDQDAAPLETDLLGLIPTVTLDAIQCAVAAVKAATPTSTTPAATALALARADGIQRAEAAIASYQATQAQAQVQAKGNAK